MNVLEFSLSVPDQLVRDLHHPVGAALGMRRDKHVLFSGHIIAKRILFLEGFLLARAHAPE